MRLDLTNKRFGRLVAVKATPLRNNGNILWECKCDCGNIKRVRAHVLRCGDTRSCGCLVKEKSPLNLVRSILHGMSRTPTWNVWQHMRRRCYDSSDVSYRYYGQRGIKVCERWQDFELFLRDMGEKPIGLSIERIDNDGDYEPSNCKWATAKEQRANQRRCVV